jgi:uncharacterized protein
MTPTRRTLLKGLLALVPIAGLAPGLLLAEAPAESVSLVIHGEQGPHRFRVEVARTQHQRSRGLMERDHLDRDAGMLFLYRERQSSRNGFWMYRTRIPLDIAFIDEDGRIVSIHRMEPCESANPRGCPVTRPKAGYRAALEVNAGVLERLGVEEGDCVSWPGSGGHCRDEIGEDA